MSMSMKSFSSPMSLEYVGNNFGDSIGSQLFGDGRPHRGFSSQLLALKLSKLMRDFPAQIVVGKIQALNLFEIENVDGIDPIKLLWDRFSVWIMQGLATYMCFVQLRITALSNNSLQSQIFSSNFNLTYLSVYNWMVITSMERSQMAYPTPPYMDYISVITNSLVRFQLRKNPLKCGLPSPKSCDPIESPKLLPTYSSDIGEENDFMDMDIFYVSFTVTYAIVLLAIVFVLFINAYWQRTWFYVVETLMTSFYYFIVDHLPKCHYI
ncbi:hypothetical protein QYF36_016893 [Acer negundo]|nr:hypothetical protein QYF36_016893 [Acer negundo]